MNGKDCQNFYSLRDPRTSEYIGRRLDRLVPVHVAIDDATAHTAAGQLALLSLANQLARTSRCISFALPTPACPVLVSTPFIGETLRELLLNTVREIDPCGAFAIASRPATPCVAIGLGADVGDGFDWYLGADRSVAHLQKSPVGFTAHRGTMRGAALASCLGAAAVFRQQLAMPVKERKLSAWNWAEGDNAAYGPDTLDLVDVGRVLMVGAGAVGASCAYWLHAFGVNGDGWAIVDADVVKMHNTNRSLVFTPRHAAWPTGVPRNKAELIAPLIPGATAYDEWYDECAEIAELRFDVVLALANERDVRERLTHRNAAVAFQATTGENWLSQLHRHILGRDGCIFCRTGETKTPVYGCSLAEVPQQDGTRSDAALPFLSAASGLMLATALQRLAGGDLQSEVTNCWSWDFGSLHRMTLRPINRLCRDGCSLVPSPKLRREFVAGTRWAFLIRD